MTKMHTSTPILATLCVHALKGKWLELTAPKSVAGPRHAVTLGSKGQILMLTLGNLHSSSVGLLVDTTAHFSSFINFIFNMQFNIKQGNR